MQQVLIAQAAEYMQLLLQDILERNGFGVSGTAANTEETLLSLKAKRPDVVLLDLSLPTTGGLACLQQILKEDPQAQVIICCSIGQQAKLLETMQAGASEFLVKPYQEDRVLDAIKKVLR
jgi:two-component system chemotaxis response regulator CheY